LIKLIVILLFISLTQTGNGQVLVKRNNADTSEVLTGVTNYLDRCNGKWLTVGANYDLINSTLGLAISNGLDEIPLIQLANYTQNLIYKINAETDFKNDYSFGANLSWKNPIRHIVLTSLEYSQFDYSESEFKFRNLDVSANIDSKMLKADLILKFGYQTLNENENCGASFGIQKVLVKQQLYSGASLGYYFDYFTYSVYLQGFVLRDFMSLRLAYNRIDNFDFINLGLNFTFTGRLKNPQKGYRWMPN
jgi:hypothetical protein